MHSNAPPADPALAERREHRLDELDLRSRIADAVGEAIIVTNRYGRIIYWNGAAQRLYGWTSEEVLGSDLLDVTAADRLPSTLRPLVAGILRGDPWSGQLLVRDRAGRIFPVEATGTALLDDGGEPIGIVTASRDVSRHHDAQEALRDSELRLQLVRRASASVIWEFDPDSDRVHWSDTLGEVFGYAQQEVEATRSWWLERVHPEDRARVEAAFEEFVTDRRRFWTDEYRFRRGDGTYADVFDRAYASPEREGKQYRMAGAMVDLSERRRLMDEQRLLSQASMILDLSMDYESTLPTVARLVVNELAELCVVKVDAAGGLPEFVSAIHRAPEEQAGLDELAEVLARGLPRNLEAMQTTSLLLATLPEGWLEAPELPQGARQRLRELRPASVILLPLSARSERLGILALARTDGMQPFDERVMHTVEELGRRIGSAIDNARLFQSARLANQAKSDFLAVISHELRTPLTAVLGYADLLAQEISGPLNERQKQQVTRIRAGTDRLHRLLESILAYVRLETTSEKPQVRTVVLDELLDRVVEIVAPRASQEGVRFRLESEHRPHEIRTDPDRLLQILLALLTNALKFVRKGDEVRLRVSSTPDSLLLDVIDTGPGIPDEHQGYVFNVFWQVEQPSTRRAGGAGLGLSVARRNARLLDGDVILADSSPAGTTFRVRLPVEPAD